MSQSGVTEPAAGSHLASVATAGDKPTYAPKKPPSDDEAEEGEIFDEEEGEISDTRLSEPATAAAPTEQDIGEPSQASPQQPSTPELPAGKTLKRDDAPLDISEASQDKARVEDAVKASIQRTARDELVQHSSESDQPPAEARSELPAEDTAEKVTAKEEAAEQLPALTAVSLPTTEAVTEPQQGTATNIAPQKADVSTPRAPEAESPMPEEAAAVAIPSQVRGRDAQGDIVKHSSTEVAAMTTSGPSAEVPAASAEKKENEPADMDIEEKVASPKQLASDTSNKPVDSVSSQESVQVDDSVHTPTLPSDDPRASVDAAIDRVVEIAIENTESAQEAAPSSPLVKAEPQTESGEQPPADSARATVAVHPEPVATAQHLSQSSAQREEPHTMKPATVAEPAAGPEAPAGRRHRSPMPQPTETEATSEAPRHEELNQHVTVNREEHRRASAEPLQSRTANRGSAVPSSISEKRIERTKERSHISERSQDREQRAREKDRRRELERIERERERERERIRESERNAEMMIARENEEARLIWLSLPGNDHPQYYTDTDSDSCYGVGGALGVELTDEEDKDLDPPLPLSLQAYHPAPSYSQSCYDDSYYASKRKRTDDASDDGLPASSHRRRREPVSQSSVEDRSALSSSRPEHRDSLSSTIMIDIDDFPVPDSSIRGEPSERPFASRIERASLPRISPYGHADDTMDEYDSSDSDEEAMRIAEERKRRHGNRSGNRGNKLSRQKGARWVRRGKLGGWTEMRMEKEIGDRVRHRVEAMQKDNVRALLSAMPEEDKAMLAQFPALRNGLLPSNAPSNARRDARGRLLPSDISEAARIDAELGLDGGSAGPSGSRPERPEHLTSTSLAPTLLKPAVTPRQLLTSHTLRHTFRNPHIGALGKTALDLIESEGVVGRAVGRCWAAMERGGWNEDPEPQRDEPEEVEAAELNGNGMDVDGSDAESSAKHVDGGGMNGASCSMFGSAIDNPALSHLDKLFVAKQGLAIPRLDDMGQPMFVPTSPSTWAARARNGMAEDAAHEAVIETTLLPAPEQRSIVLAALECLHDLAADSREYVERLEEVRSRLAAVKRRRAQVWNAVRQWALDKDIEASMANGGAMSQEGASETTAEAATTAAAAALKSAAAASATAVTNGASPKKRK
ncbi:uncharacterized protein MEPE_01936 [Melanopsichium pennsylvanicum]|uniref:Uncharacterized protein n=2 Tax=Melanopsichium pennsylvanicum TaxID=63383 RepID=A0AAJ4XJC0_9BASI|nr:putative protein [Melanopsichium pennsylvanicum 4]SNX83230.1 uncharacterized protein MEPE_01936 [Melanopsichium pennsylvanicum]